MLDPFGGVSEATEENELSEHFVELLDLLHVEVAVELVYELLHEDVRVLVVGGDLRIAARCAGDVRELVGDVVARVAFDDQGEG